jgi:zinc and cadmium transporter
MPLFYYIIVFSIIGSVVSLVGGLILLWREKMAKSISMFLVSFAAGALIGVAFFDLLPGALEGVGDYHNAFFYALIGIVAFFIIEKFLLWYHCHDEEKCPVHSGTKFLILFGDSVHNFIDGVIIALGFFVSIPLGITTAIAVALHEIPQEIGDFGILLHLGIQRKKVLLYNLLAASTTIVGAVLTYFFVSYLENIMFQLIAIAAGSFIYIASADLIPEIHLEKRKYKSIVQVLLFVCGITVVKLSGIFLGH